MDYTVLLKQLTNEQLMELAAVVTKEGIMRQIDTEMKEVMLEEAEIAQIYKQAYAEEMKLLKIKKREEIAEQARAKAQQDITGRYGKFQNENVSEQIKTWRSKKAIAMALEYAGINSANDWYLRVWNTRDKRIYFQSEERGTDYATYHHEGTDSTPPKNLCCHKGLSDILRPGDKLTNQQKARIKALFGAICKKWESLSLDSDAIASFNEGYDQKALNYYKQAIDLAT